MMIAITTTITPKELSNASELLLQRCCFWRRLFQQPGNTAHLSLHSGRHDRRVPSPKRYSGTAEDHVVAIAEFGFFLDGKRVFRHRQALSGKRGLGRLQCCRMNQPCIGGNGIAFFNNDDVARHQLSRRDARC